MGDKLFENWKHSLPETAWQRLTSSANLNKGQEELADKSLVYVEKRYGERTTHWSAPELLDNDFEILPPSRVR